MKKLIILSLAITFLSTQLINSTTTVGEYIALRPTAKTLDRGTGYLEIANFKSIKPVTLIAFNRRLKKNTGKITIGPSGMVGEYYACDDYDIYCSQDGKNVRCDSVVTVQETLAPRVPKLTKELGMGAGQTTC